MISSACFTYAILDREETVDMSLVEGEQLQVSMTHVIGDVDVRVGRMGKEPIYQGSGQTNADFVLIIPETGTYRISITGHRAKGAVSFVRTAAEGQSRTKRKFSLINRLTFHKSYSSLAFSAF